MSNSLQSHLRSKAKLLLLISLVIAVVGTIDFYRSSEVTLPYTLLWFVFLWAASLVSLFVLHAVLYFVLARR